MKPIKLASLLKEEPLVPVAPEDNTYMFFQNLKTIHHAVCEMMKMDKETVKTILADGHGWALDHIATSADDVDEVYHFLSGNVGHNHMNEAQVGTPGNSNTGKIKVGSIVIPRVGPHKGVKHRVIYSAGPRINIKPILPKLGMNKYKLGAASTTTNLVDLVKESTINEVMGAFRRLVITSSKMDLVKKELEDFIKRPNIKADYSDMKVSMKPGIKPDMLVVDIEAISGTALANKLSDVVKKHDKGATIKVRKELKLKPTK